jgi:hypothetical protein
MRCKSLFALAFFGLTGNIHAATIGTVSDRVEIELGETFSVDIMATDFDVVLDGGGLDIHFDPAIVQLDYATVDTAVWDPLNSGISGGIDNTNGEISGIHFASSEDVTGDFPIATLGFTATALGMSPLQLIPNDMNPFISGGAITPVTLENGAINVVAPVPLPAAAWFMLSGLGIFIGWSSRRTVD